MYDDCFHLKSLNVTKVIMKMKYEFSESIAQILIFLCDGRLLKRTILLHPLSFF